MKPVTAVGTLSACLLVAGCGQVVPATTPSTNRAPYLRESTPPPTPTPTPTPTPSPTPSPTQPPTQAPADASPVTGTPTLTPHPVTAIATTPPPWLGKRVLPRTPAGHGRIEPTPKELRDREFTLPDTLPELPGAGFAAKVRPAPSSVIARSTWRPGCPVAADQLSWVQLTFWGFDHERHTGELLVNRSVATDVVSVFHELYRDRFPIEQMTITTKAEQTAPPTGDGNDTSAFDCRPTRGSTSFSQHAYGLAVDVDPFQNPYSKGTPPNRVVLPELASSYLNRSWDRPGMISPGGPVVRAFARIGWGWGGSWHSLKDRMHFSANGT